MRRSVAAVVLLFGLLGLAQADTIRLKNGTSIFADKVTDKGEQIEYIVGATRYTIPKSAVSSIEHGSTFGVSIGTAKPGAAAALSIAPAGSAIPPAATPAHIGTAVPAAPKLRGFDPDALLSQVVNVGNVDEPALYKIEGEGPPLKAAAAYVVAASFSYDHNQKDAARKYMKRAIQLAPNQVDFSTWYSGLLLENGQNAEAISEGERVLQIAPNSVDALRLLGLAYYNSGRLSDAIKTWKRAQDIHPSGRITEYLAKAEREASVEEGFTESENAHFVLRYEGRQAGFSLRSELLRTLDRQFTELSRDLGFAPEHPITVILYTEQQFLDVTEAPAWSGGLNDGKLRIPVRDVSGMTPRLQAVLKHELTHSFVHSVTGSRCPVWLNEGLAQMEEPQTADRYAPLLAELFRRDRAAPLAVLEGSFIRLTPAQVEIAYAESLAATEYLRATYGMNALRRMLTLIAEGEEPETALQVVTQGSNYSRLESALAAHLSKMTKLEE